MTKFRVTFEIDGKQLEKAYDFAAEMRTDPVIQRIADSRKSGKAGGQTGYATVAAFVGKNGPVKTGAIREALAAAGFNPAGSGSHIHKCLTLKTIKRTAK